MTAVSTVILQDVPPYLMAAGNTSSPYGINVEGLKRRGFTPEQIANIKSAYRVLYRSGLKLAEAAAELETLAREQPEVRPLVELLQRSTRSIVR